MSKGPDAFRTISEVAKALDLPQHVLRFWETRFPQVKPLKRGGGRRYYRPDDVDLLRGIRQLLYGEGFTIKGVQRILKEQGPRFVIDAGRGETDGTAALGNRPTSTLYPEPLEEDDRPNVAAGDYEADDDAAADDDAPAKSHGVAHLRVIEGSAPTQRPAGLSGEDVRALRAALDELLECKRILERTR